jgi:hypothetical protein
MVSFDPKASGRVPVSLPFVFVNSKFCFFGFYLLLFVLIASRYLFIVW